MNTAAIARSQLLLAILVIVTHPFNSWASDSVSCDAALTQSDLTECFGSPAANAQAGLDRDIAAYVPRLSDSQKQLFDASQAAWVKFRAAACAFQASGAEGGSAHPMVLSTCFEALTNERRKAIAELASCEEGDLSCPAPP